VNQWYKPRKPEQIEAIPWLAPAATAYLESLLTPDFEVIEHGAGGSTLWFAERVACVTAFEDKDEWARVVERNVSARKAAVVSGFYTGLLVDLLLIDGEPVEDRAKWILAAPQIVKPGGWVVLDNANRPEYAAERKELFKHADLIHTVNSNREAGYLYLITEFWRVKQAEE
jgi:predicted O-methyltransferase YrrM